LIQWLDILSSKVFNSVDEVIVALKNEGYFADRALATSVFLALKLKRPLLLEGEPGVGKTELSKALARALERVLLRLQCYDGLDQREAMYEWNYTAQLLHVKVAQGGDQDDVLKEIYQRRYLISRPLLQAIECSKPGAVLLIDEIDRADEPFEAYLLEYLAEYQITIPELGTIQAQTTPITILTSNRTRELNDAIKRRCLYHWLDYPSRKRELEILQVMLPNAPEKLTAQIALFVSRLRESSVREQFTRAPGIAESIEWAKALIAMDTLVIDPEIVHDTAGILFKQRDDISSLNAQLVTDLLTPELI
jgi:MoxR-like ATPase